MALLSPYQMMLLKAAHFLRKMPLDYSSVDLDPNHDLREERHEISREFIRAIASGDAATVERNTKIDLAKEFKRAKAKGDIRIINTNSESSSDTEPR